MTAVGVPDPAIRNLILDGLDIEIDRPKLSLPYRIGLLLVAVVMILLPLIYLALVLAAGYGVYWHATENVTIFEEVRSGRNAMFAYLTPLIVGVILVFFMVKPLLAPRGKRPDPFVADRDKQPFLYDFVESLCDAVGAPAPRRILLDCEANASAGFHQGGLGLMSSGRELTIGLPLVGAMSVRQLAGVLAHEFGHFSQGAAMRLSFVVMAVNSWFARVVFERDSWDQSLIDWSRSNVGYLSWPAGLARGCVWMTRRILYGLMWLGHVVSSNMSRQMEYDADSFEIQLAGSKSFSESMLKVVELSAAQNAAMNNLQESWEQKQLADDFPQLVVQRYDDIGDEIRGRIRESLEEEETSLFASHPRSIDRMAVAIKAREAGAFQVDASAVVLFDDYAGTCKAASQKHYKGMLGRLFKTDYLVDIGTFLGDREQARKERTAVLQFFQTTANAMLPMPFPSRFDGDPRAELDGLRRATVEHGKEFDEPFQKMIAVHNALSQNELVRVWIELKLKLDMESFGLDEATEEAVDRRAAELATERSAAEAEVARLLETPSRRVACVAAAAPDSEHAAELRQLVTTANKFGGIVPNLVLLRGRMTILSELFGHETDKESHQNKLNRWVSRHSHKLRDELEAISEALGDDSYPFQHAEGAVTARKVCLPSVPKADSIDRLWESAVKAEDTLSNLYWRILGRIAFLGEQIETELGLAPLPAPPTPPAEPEE